MSIPQEIKLDVIFCPRCMGDHKQVEFKPFRLYPVGDPEGDYTHWGFCPKTGSPIMMRYSITLAGEPPDQELS